MRTDGRSDGRDEADRPFPQFLKRAQNLPNNLMSHSILFVFQYLLLVAVRLNPSSGRYIRAHITVRRAQDRHIHISCSCFMYIICLTMLLNESKHAFLWVITQQLEVIPYRRFGTTYRSHLQGILDP